MNLCLFMFQQYLWFISGIQPVPTENYIHDQIGRDHLANCSLVL
ncbi:MAG: hypothetical protein ACYSSN_04100 [Planctomycetota bacterium]